MGQCNKTIPFNEARPRSCVVCGLGPCKLPQSILHPTVTPAERQQLRPNQEPFISVARPEHPTAPALSLSSDDQRIKASLALNDELERELLRRLGEVKTRGGDGRCLSLAKTHLQTAFMWLNRAVVDRKREWPEDTL